jgi:rod shape-determining protein MreB
MDSITNCYNLIVKLLKIQTAIDFFSNFYWDIGVDLGTSNTLIYLRDRGVVIDEPTMIARLKKKRWTGLSAPRWKGSTTVAFGYKAKEMFNREPMQIEVVSPIKNGIISDLEGIENLVGYLLKMVYEIPSKYPKMFKPRVIVSVPGSISEVQKRAVKSVFLSSGAREVILVEGVVLAAVGLGLPTERSAGLLVVDIGGGKTEVGVISMGGVVVGRGIKTAGNDFDTSIMNYIKMKYGLLVGQNSAEKVKIDLGNVFEKETSDKKTAVLRGRDLETGLPKTVKIGETEIREAIFLEAQKIIKLIKEELDETPPELMEDVLKKGIVLVGNGANLRGFDRLVEKETKVSTRIAEDPGYCIIRGCGELMENPKLFENIRIVSGLGK